MAGTRACVLRDTRGYEQSLCYSERLALTSPILHWILAPVKCSMTALSETKVQNAVAGMVSYQKILICTVLIHTL